MSDYNFIRFFVILNENNKNYGTVTAPNGYCKVEGLNGNAVFTVSVRNLKKSDGNYRLYLLLKGSDMPVYVGEFAPNDDGMVYKNYQTKADNIFESGCEIASIEAMHILADDNESVLCGYINRSMTMQARQFSDAKLNNIMHTEDGQNFRAAGICEDKELIEGSLPSELESEETQAEPTDMSEPESESIDADTAEADEAETNTAGAISDTSDSFSSYVQTLARLYEGIVNAGGAHEEKKPTASQSCGYWSKVGAVYDSLFDGEENIVPFDFFKSNSKWISIAPYADNVTYLQLIGLIYANGSVKYIVNGTPVYANMLCTPCVVPCMLWLPAKQNSRGIIGYWLTFIDAQTGRQTEPDICVL